jgi:hypothetical protein
VDILDLLTIASYFGYHVNAAPSTQALYRSLYVQLMALQNPSGDVIRALELLRKLMLLEESVQTRLLQNYPNPFNPETWIPYVLERV